MVLSLILDNHMCAYDTDIYRVLTLKIKHRFLWMYAYPCTISTVCNVGTRLYYLTRLNFGFQYCS